MGGVATSVIDDDVPSVLKVSEGEEFIITRHSQFQKPINIINIYGNIESRSRVETTDSKWEDIMAEIVKIEARGELLIFLGDFNNYVGRLIPDNHSKVSHGGKAILKLIEDGDYVLVNATNKCQGGPFTRYDPGDPDMDEKKSAIDFIIVSKELHEFIEDMEIDSKLKWTPCRPISKNKVRFSDHYAIKIVFKNLLMKKKVTTKKRRATSNDYVWAHDLF